MRLDEVFAYAEDTNDQVKPCPIPVVLAPLAGITDLPFRQLVHSFGASWVVSEMVASQEMVQDKPGVRERAELGFDQDNTIVQLAGKDPYWIAQAAQMVEANGARAIDINMGCPAKKVTNGYSGSALMRKPDFALSLIEAVVGAVDIPVTLKMRLGWDHECLNAADIARRAEEAGVRLITIHGRTRCQFYKGRADWDAIGDVKQVVSIPVIANGDIVDESSARQALKSSGANGIMVGRAVQGRPWLLAQIHGALNEAAVDQAYAPSGAQFYDLVARHYEAMLSFYGTELGVKMSRKHLGWYMEQTAVERALRKEILTCKMPSKVLDKLSVALTDFGRSTA